MDDKSREDIPNVVRIGSFRKRPLEVTGVDGLNVSSEHDRAPNSGESMEHSPPPKHTAGPNAVIDEVELHFQRSLSKTKTQKTSVSEREVSCKDVSKTHLKWTQQSSDSTAGLKDCKGAAMESLTLENFGSCSTVVVGNRTETHPVRSDPSFGRSSCGNTLAKKNHEIVKVVASRMTPHVVTADVTSPTAYKVGVPGTIVTADVTSPTAYKVGVPGTIVTADMTSPTAYKVGVPGTIVTADVTSPTAYKVGVPGTIVTADVTSPTAYKVGVPGTIVTADVTSPTAYKVGMPGTIVTADVTSPTAYKVGVPGTITTTQSGTVQVIDLTRHGSSDAHLSRNGMTSSSQTRSLSLVKPQIANNDVVMNCKGKLCSDSSVIAGNGSVSASSKGNSVILLPTTGNVGSTVMMQPQPYILVNPGAEIPRSNPPPLISPSVYCGNPGSGYILLSPNQNSLLQVVSSAGVCAPHSGIVTPTPAPASQLTFISSSPKQPVKPLNSTKVACTSFITEDSKKDDINVMPASVEDHFAKALGDQWSKLNPAGNGVSPSSSTVIS